MKNNDIFRELGNVDEKYILEADPMAVRSSTRRRKFTVLAACVSMFAVFLSLWLFLPFSGELEDLSRYADSEYYALMLKVQQLASRPDNYRFKNNFDKYFKTHTQSDTNGIDTVGSVTAQAPADKYTDVTDNQYDGVIEGDLFKRNENCIFYLDPQAMRLYSYSIDSAEMLDSVSIPYETGIQITEVNNANSVLYISQGGDSVSVILPKYQKTAVVSFDVSDPADIKKTELFEISGGYITSRMKDGKLLLVTGWGVATNPDFSEKGEYLPQFTSGGKTEALAADSISFTDDAWRAFYTVVALIDPATLEVIDSAAVLDYAYEISVSEENIFLACTYSESTSEPGEKENETITNNILRSEIYVVSHSNGTLENKGHFSVKGLLIDQYALDEKDGVLRLVTETSYTKYVNVILPEGGYSFSQLDWYENADLYCIDLETFEIIGSVIAFAPEGEEVTSVRFEGDYGYVCTADTVYHKDPVYFFDLSDPANITYSDTGVIEGYSTSLVELDGGYLLGIGYGDSNTTLKLEIYAERDGAVVSVCAYEIEGVGFSEDYKSYYINRNENLFGLMTSTSYASEYVLLQFDGQGLVIRESVDFHCVASVDWVRATVIDGKLFVFAEYECKILKIDR